MTSESLHDPALPGPAVAGGDGADLARQLYRAVGSVPGLILPGAAVVSVKGVGYDLLGHAADTLWINGSGTGSGAENPPITAVRLDAVLWLQQIAGLDAALLPLALRQALLRPDLPNPPPVALLHAVVPAPVAVLVQPAAVLAAGATAEPLRLLRAMLGEEVLFVEECAAAQTLAGEVAALLRPQPAAAALLIGQCGLLVWGDDAAAVVQRAVALAERADRHAAAQAGASRLSALAQPENEQGAIAAALLPALRGLLGAAGQGILRFDASAAVRAAVRAALDGVQSGGREAVDDLLARAGIAAIWIDLPAGGELSAQALAAALSPEDRARLEANGGRQPVAALLPRLRGGRLRPVAAGG